jgi:hypothetical protein
MWIGELDKSEGTKFTGSADQSGDFKAHIHMNHKKITLTMSFIKKRCINFIFKVLVTPLGVLLPLKWRRIK